MTTVTSTRSISRQTVDTLHLILRVLLGVGVLFGAAQVTIAFVLYVMSDKLFGRLYETSTMHGIYWPIYVALAGTLPSLASGAILIVKNKLVLRNPIETLLGMLNIVIVVTCLNLLYQSSSHGMSFFDTGSTILACTMYGISAIAVIIASRRDLERNRHLPE